MKKYIGTKIVKAEPMNRVKFLMEEKDEPVVSGEDEPGYKVEYPDGYVSWSPKSQFETAYRELTTDEYWLVV